MNLITLESRADYLRYQVRADNTVEILDIAVGTERGAGRGSELIRKLLEELKTDTDLVYALTRASNEQAHRFYVKNGFKRIGILDGFYKDLNESAHVYGKETV